MPVIPYKKSPSLMLQNPAEREACPIDSLFKVDRVSSANSAATDEFVTIYVRLNMSQNCWHSFCLQICVTTTLCDLLFREGHVTELS